MTVALFVRGSTVISKPFNIDTQPLLFVTVLLGISSADCTWNGFDPNMRLGQHSYAIPRFGSFELVELQSLLLYAAKAMHGRGTKVPHCQARFQLSDSPVPCVLKISWLPLGSTTDIEICQLMNTRELNVLTDREKLLFGEEDLHGVFRNCIKPNPPHPGLVAWDYQRYLPGIPVILPKDCVRPKADNPRPNDNLREQGYYEPDRKPNVRPDTTRNILQRFSIPVRNSEGDIVQVRAQREGEDKPTLGPIPMFAEIRECICVLSRTCGTSLVWFSCRREFLNGMMGAIAGKMKFITTSIKCLYVVLYRSLQWP